MRRLLTLLTSNFYFISQLAFHGMITDFYYISLLALQGMIVEVTSDLCPLQLRDLLSYYSMQKAVVLGPVVQS